MRQKTVVLWFLPYEKFLYSTFEAPPVATGRPDPNLFVPFAVGELPQCDLFPVLTIKQGTSSYTVAQSCKIMLDALWLHTQLKQTWAFTPSQAPSDYHSQTTSMCLSIDEPRSDLCTSDLKLFKLASTEVCCPFLPIYMTSNSSKKKKT